jgi:anti-anti-sigma factor
MAWGSPAENGYPGSCAGHGDFDPGNDEGVLVLTQQDGRADLVAAHRLTDLLRQARPMPRLVVLNSCSSAAAGASDLFSGTAAALVRGGVSAVAAMQYEISDLAAVAFARGFYAAIARGRGVDDAVSNGRVAILGLSDRTLEWVTPVLYLRGHDTRLFTLPAPANSTNREGPQKAASGTDLGGPTELSAPAVPPGLSQKLPGGPIQSMAARAAQVSFDDPSGVALVLGTPQEPGDPDAIAIVLARDPAAHISLDNPGIVARLLRVLREVGDSDAIATLLARDPAAHVSLDDPGSVALLEELREAGDGDAVATLRNEVKRLAERAEAPEPELVPEEGWAQEAVPFVPEEGPMPEAEQQDEEEVLRPAKGLTFRVRRRRDCAIVTIAGEIGNSAASHLRELLIDLVNRNNYQIIVNIDEAEFLDTTGLGVLSGGLKRVQAHQGSLDLVCTRERTLQIFRITGLIKRFDSCETVDQAIAAKESR